jgi:glycosyltransferase involved in cell wall biosynthesis
MRISTNGGSKRPARIGIMNDYVRIPYANGSSFASQFLYREFTKRGHEVTVIGPRDPSARPEDLPPRHVCFDSLPLRNHPGVQVPFPSPAAMREVAARKLDIAVAQSANELNALGVWLRHTHDVPFMSVNTLHLPSVYDVILPESLHGNRAIDGFFLERVVPWLEKHSADVYNKTDGLIVLSKGLERYWRERGVTAPIHVIPRSVDPTIFDRASDPDPFDPQARPGGRFLCVCRHTREKGVLRLIQIFARHIAPEMPSATLTLVGDGPDHDAFKAAAESLGVGHKVFFPGEFPVTEIPAFYRHADLFLYTSLSETYGQVVSESMWCGLPLVAFEDDKGVSHQIQSGKDGFLIPPGPDEDESNRQFAASAIGLVTDPARLAAFSREAERATHLRSDPTRCIERYYEAFAAAKDNLEATREARRKIDGRLSLVRWTWVHATIVGLGLIRPPATVNRHGRKQPSWDALAELDKTVSLPSAASNHPSESSPLTFALRRAAGA